MEYNLPTHRQWNRWKVKGRRLRTNGLYLLIILSYVGRNLRLITVGQRWSSNRSITVPFVELKSAKSREFIRITERCIHIFYEVIHYDYIQYSIHLYQIYSYCRRAEED